MTANTEKLPGLQPLLQSAPKDDPDLFADWLGEVLHEISLITSPDGDGDLVAAFTLGLISMAARDAALRDHIRSSCWHHSLRRAAQNCFEGMYEDCREHYVELDAEDAAEEEEEERQLAAMSASPAPGVH